MPACGGLLVFLVWFWFLFFGGVFGGVLVGGFVLLRGEAACVRLEKLLAIGVEPQRHRRACTERREQEIVRTWAAVEPTHAYRRPLAGGASLR